MRDVGGVETVLDGANDEECESSDVQRCGRRCGWLQERVLRDSMRPEGQSHAQLGSRKPVVIFCSGIRQLLCNINISLLDTNENYASLSSFSPNAIYNYHYSVDHGANSGRLALETRDNLIRL